MPKVTIITACRNAHATIEWTIRSVITQSVTGLEYVVVDADSDDGTAEIIEEYKDHVAVWIREPDSGIADAWNKGIRAATGEIIGILNADDFYTPESISAVVEALERHAECGFVFGNLKMTNNGNGKSYVVAGRQDYERTVLYDMRGVPHPTVFVRKWVYDRLGLFDTRYAICADYEFIRRVVFHGIKGVYVPHLLAVMGEGGLSERDRIWAAREVMDISVKYGANRTLALCCFCTKCLRFYAGRFMDRCGFSLSTQRRLLHGFGSRH